MTNTQPRGPVRLTTPTRDGNGWSRHWQRIIGGTLYAFAAIVMPITGELRYTVRRYTKPASDLPRFDCDYKTVHSLTINAGAHGALAWRRVRPGLYVGAAGGIDRFEVIRDSNARTDNMWAVRAVGDTTNLSTHRLLKTGQGAAARYNGKANASTLISALARQAETNYGECTGAVDQTTMGSSRPHSGPMGTYRFASGAVDARLCEAHGGMYGDLARLVMVGPDPVQPGSTHYTGDGSTAGCGEMYSTDRLTSAEDRVDCPRCVKIIKVARETRNGTTAGDVDALGAAAAAQGFNLTVHPRSAVPFELVDQGTGTMHRSFPTYALCDRWLTDRAAEVGRLTAAIAAVNHNLIVVKVAEFFRQYFGWPSPAEIAATCGAPSLVAAAVDAGAVEVNTFGDRELLMLPVPNPHQAIAVDDIVTITPGRGRQFDVIEVFDLDGMVRVVPRRRLSTEDGPRWVGIRNVHRVPPAIILPSDADLDDQEPAPAPEPLRLLPGGAELETGRMTITPSGADKIRAAAERNRAARHQARSCCAATDGDVHMRTCQSPEAVEQRAPRKPRPVEQPARSVADMIMPAMAGQYRAALTHLLARHGFTAPAGIDVRVPDDANPDAFVVHDPTGIAIGAYDRYLRVSYPAVHAGEGDGDVGTAWFDLAYGTSYETVDDIAAGLVQQLMRRAHLDHMYGVAEELRAIAGHPLNRASVMVSPGDLTDLADQLAAVGTECKAAAYARRATAVLTGVMVKLVDLAERGEPVDAALLRSLALVTAEALNAPDPDVEGLVEHLKRGADAAIVADESVTPADVDALVDTLVGAGWEVAGEPEYVFGKRVRYLVPPTGQVITGAVERPAVEPLGFHDHMLGSNVDEIVDQAGYLVCGCHGAQRDHTCEVYAEPPASPEE